MLKTTSRCEVGARRIPGQRYQPCTNEAVVAYRCPQTEPFTRVCDAHRRKLLAMVAEDEAAGPARAVWWKELEIVELSQVAQDETAPTTQSATRQGGKTGSKSKKRMVRRRRPPATKVPTTQEATTYMECKVEKYLSVKQVAELTGMHTQSVYREIWSGNLNARRLSPRRLRVSESDLQEYLERHFKEMERNAS